MFGGYPEFEAHRGRCRVMDSVEETVSFLKRERGSAVVLASGDPLFFGIGRRLLEEFPQREVELHPAVSSMQLAFARVKAPWEDAFFVSLHGPKKREWEIGDLPLLLELYAKLVILTGGENTPQKIASELPSDVRVYVLERLGYPDERLREGGPSKIKRMKFKEPNLVLVMSEPSDMPVFGIREGEFRHTRGLITKDEVRAVVLHKLRLPGRGVLWDIGAGSGSVSIEAKRLSPALRVYAIEKDASRAKNILANSKRLAAGVQVTHGGAPAALKGLPAPDRVFIGGSGRGVSGVIKYVSSRMKKGVVVATAITLESLNETSDALKAEGFSLDFSSISVSRAEPLKGRRYLRAMNPVFVMEAAR